VVEVLPEIVWFVLLVYGLIDCIQSPEGQVRNLPKVGWILLIVLVPVAGPIAWLVAGRPVGAGARSARVPWRSTATAGFPEYERPRRFAAPDDDPAFLTGIDAPDPEHEELLRKWEAQLREREARLGKSEVEGKSPPPSPEAPGSDDPARPTS